MAVKIYLSPACHQYDNPCSAEKGCTENAHANIYLDELTPYLDACGFEWKRNGKEFKGGDGIKKAVSESNEWGADLHYVVHTNAFDSTVKGSRPMVYPKGDGKEWANVIKKWREKIYPHPITVKEKTDLYEINSTRCVCIYEELVFHDNKEDATWLHNNLRVLAEYTAKAFCEIFGVEFVDPYAREKGDVDGDGDVDSADALLALNAYAKKTELSDEQKEAADMDNDGDVDSSDAMQILKKYAKSGE